MGEVYRARDTRLERVVALKILPEDAAADPERRHRFEREARAVATLDHPHVVAVHDVGTEEGVAYVVFELIEGETLRSRLVRGPLAPRKAVEYAVQLCRGLAAAHARGILHRDLKPENVILRPNPNGWHAVIFDFNLSRMKDSKGKMSSLTSMHAAIGTVPYMAPEQLLDARRVNESSDVYSCGTILYRAVAGTLPFDTRASLREKLQQEAPPLRTGRSDHLAVGFEQIVGRALRRRPADRYTNAQQMLDDLTHLAAGG
jgi:serine/threonine protein kinase